MGRVLAVMNVKSGVGRTTVTANVGVGLCLLGFNVCLIDMQYSDELIRAAGLSGCRRVDGRAILYPRKHVRTEFVVGGHSLSVLRLDGSDLIATDMDAIVDWLKDRHQYVLIDAPHGIGRGFHNAMGAADTVLLVTTPNLIPLRNAEHTLSLIPRPCLQAFDERPSVVVNRIRPDLMDRGVQYTLRQIAQDLSLPVIGAVPDCDDVHRSFEQGGLLAGPKRSQAGIEFLNIAKRIAGLADCLDLDLPDRGDVFMRYFWFGTSWLHTHKRETSVVPRDKMLQSPVRAPARAMLGRLQNTSHSDSQRFDVFIAYNSQDRQQVEGIARDLLRRGIRPWMDVAEIQPGTRFLPQIEHAIGKVNCAAIFIGPSGIGKYQQLELDALLTKCAEQKAHIIPVLLPGVNSVPNNAMLQSRTWVRFTSVKDNAALDNLLWGITAVDHRRKTV